MNSDAVVLAAPDPQPARRRAARHCATHQVHGAPKRRRFDRSLACTLFERVGGNFVGGRMGTSFGPF